MSTDNVQLNYEKILKGIEASKLELLDIIQEIEYFHNGEDMGFIYAVDHTNGLACRTNFFEMDDFYIGSDYLIVAEDNTQLVCQFELKG